MYIFYESWDLSRIDDTNELLMDSIKYLVVDLGILVVAIIAQITCLKYVADPENKKIMSFRRIACILLLPNLAIMVNFFSIQIALVRNITITLVSQNVYFQSMEMMGLSFFLIYNSYSLLKDLVWTVSRTERFIKIVKGEKKHIDSFG